MSQSQFIDEAQINVRGGDGGAGCVSFLRESMRPNGGPDGGDGGVGGNLILVADASVGTLLRFTHAVHHKATSGAHGSGRHRHGRSGEDLTVRVPAGTTVRTLDGDIVADLANPGDAYVAAQAGRGGRGNARFLSNRRRAPTFAEQGEPGEERWLRLELRLLADVALIGYPNAGKSTFVASVSAARPKIAAYPFTTLTPNLGVVAVDDEEFVIADIPGLIEGAAEGKGLGHRFLRHVERSRALLVLLDPLNPEASIDEQEEVLLRELGSYRPELLERPRVVAVTKADALTTEDRETLEIDRPAATIISAATGEAMKPLMRRVAQLVTKQRDATPAEVGFVVHRPIAKGFTVGRADDGAWIVDGPDARRAVALSDLTDAQALDFLQDRLRGLGVDAALVEHGVADGDEVRIGEFAFSYSPDAPPAKAKQKRPLAGGGRKRTSRSQVRR